MSIVAPIIAALFSASVISVLLHFEVRASWRAKEESNDGWKCIRAGKPYQIFAVFLLLAIVALFYALSFARTEQWFTAYLFGGFLVLGTLHIVNAAWFRCVRWNEEEIQARSLFGNVGIKWGDLILVKTLRTPPVIIFRAVSGKKIFVPLRGEAEKLVLCLRKEIRKQLRPDASIKLPVKAEFVR